MFVFYVYLVLWVWLVSTTAKRLAGKVHPWICICTETGSRNIRVVNFLYTRDVFVFVSLYCLVVVTVTVFTL